MIVAMLGVSLMILMEKCSLDSGKKSNVLLENSIDAFIVVA